MIIKTPVAVRFHKIEEHFKQFRKKVIEKYRSVGGYKKQDKVNILWSSFELIIRKLNEYGTGLNLP